MLSGSNLTTHRGDDEAVSSSRDDQPQSLQVIAPLDTLELANSPDAMSPGSYMAPPTVKNLWAPQVLRPSLMDSIPLPPAVSEMSDTQCATIHDQDLLALHTQTVTSSTPPTLDTVEQVEPLPSRSVSTVDKSDSRDNIETLSKKCGVALGTPLITLVKLNVKPGSRQSCTSVTLECMPESRYGARQYYNAHDDPEAKQAETVLNSSQETVAYIDSYVTEEYWPLKDNRSNETAESNTIKNVKNEQQMI